MNVEDAPGKIVNLYKGYTHYHLDGNYKGDLIVFIHGYSSYSSSWASSFLFFIFRVF
jgi:hypothetical protein